MQWLMDFFASLADVFAGFDLVGLMDTFKSVSAQLGLSLDWLTF
jgi:hypothetical protein